MAYVTRAQAVAASRTSWGTRTVAESKMMKSAGAPMSTPYDIFLSHAYEDAEMIAGVAALIEQEGLAVYVDWIEDPQADRSLVTPRTADLLRRRMRHCQFLLLATSDASPDSKWLPWELGYFDGFRPDRVGILPIVESVGGGFNGQEYIGLDPKFELIEFKVGGRRLGRVTGTNTGLTLKDAALRD
jgi:hypothetical protein